MINLFASDITFDEDQKFSDDTFINGQRIIINAVLYGPGRHLKIIAKELRLGPNAIIDASSPDLATINQRKGTKGGQHPSGHGQPGTPGVKGASAGEISIFAETIFGEAILRAIGPDGAKGGDGGDGRNGRVNDSTYRCPINRICTEAFGSSGRDSGKPGLGSDGGDGGNIRACWIKSEQEIPFVDVDARGGSAGPNGEVGKAGLRGQHGSCETYQGPEL